jgi:hypothetical protein
MKDIKLLLGDKWRSMSDILSSLLCLVSDVFCARWLPDTRHNNGYSWRGEYNEFASFPYRYIIAAVKPTRRMVYLHWRLQNSLSFTYVSLTQACDLVLREHNKDYKQGLVDCQFWWGETSSQHCILWLIVLSPDESEYDQVSKRDRLGLTPNLTTRDLWRSRSWARGNENFCLFIPVGLQEYFYMT